MANVRSRPDDLLGVAMRAFCTDSDEAYLSLFKRYLGYQEIVVDVESDSSKALSIIEEKEYDVVVGGWMMLPVEAIRFFTSIRDHLSERVAEVPLICFGPEEVDLEEFMLLDRLNVGLISSYRSFDMVASRLRMVARGGVEAS